MKKHSIVAAYYAVLIPCCLGLAAVFCGISAAYHEATGCDAGERPPYTLTLSEWLLAGVLGSAICVEQSGK